MPKLFPIRIDHLRVKEIIPEIILLAEILTYSIVFSYLTALKFQAFGMYAWDLGVYHQAIHTTVTSGDFFFSTVELPYTQTVVPKGTQFAVHFSPFLFLLLPFYALYQSPITLFVIKSVAIAVGAIPVYLLSKKELGSSILGLAFSTAYLLLPALHGINWYDFQPHAFLPTFLLFTLLYMERKQTKFALFFLTLALSTIEIAPFLGIGIGLSSLVLNRKSVVEMFRKHEIFALLKSMPLAIILVSSAWLAIVYSTSILFGWQGSFHLSNMRRVEALGAFSFAEALSFDWQAKVLYITLIFGPLAFLSFLDLPRVFAASFWMFVAVFSDYPPYYSIGFQYLTFVVPFVIYSAIFGFKKLNITARQRTRRYVSVLLVVTITSSAIIASPIGPFHIGNHNWAGPFGMPTVSQHDVNLQNLIDLIPKDASVLTQNNIFPHVSNRRDAYVFPFASTFSHSEDFESTLEAYLEKVEFILIDATRDPICTITTFLSLGGLEDFGIYAEAEGSILFRRGYNGPMITFIPYRTVFDYNDLVIKNGTIVEDPFAASVKVMHHGYSEAAGDFWFGPIDFWWGPGVFLGRGNYSVDFRLKLSEVSPNSVLNVIVLAVVTWPAILTIEMQGSELMGFVPKVNVTSSDQEVSIAKTLRVRDFTRYNEYQKFTLQFDVDKPAGFEFVGLGVTEDIDIYLDYIELVQVSP